MPNPFYNAQEKRIRALWRVVLNGVVFGAIVLFASVPLVGVYISQFENPADINPEQLATAPFVLTGSSVISLVAAIAVLWLSARFVDKRPLTEYGLQIATWNWWRDLIFGAGLGALLMTMIFLVEQLLGWVQIVDVMTAGERPFWGAMGLSVLTFLCIGIYEELIFRGYHLLNFAEGLNLPQLGERGGIILAWVLTSVIFGAAHAFNPNATTLSTLYIMLAGVMLGAGYVLTGSLAVPIGLHITWNFFQTSVFGFPVSGMQENATFIAVEQLGPEAWTGGAFGPEAGFIGVLGMLAGIVLIGVYTQIMHGTLHLHRPLARYPSSTDE